MRGLDLLLDPVNGDLHATPSPPLPVGSTNFVTLPAPLDSVYNQGVRQVRAWSQSLPQKEDFRLHTPHPCMDFMYTHSLVDSYGCHCQMSQL